MLLFFEMRFEGLVRTGERRLDGAVGRVRFSKVLGRLATVEHAVVADNADMAQANGFWQRFGATLTF